MRLRTFFPSKILVFIAFLVPLGLCGQSVVQGAMTGSVAGHIYCADTNRPCRFASILLQPVPLVGTAGGSKASATSGKTFSGMSGLDGSFTIANVAPGTYDVIAELPGYVSVAEEFPPEEMRKASVELKRKLDEVSQKVTVDPNQTSPLAIVLQRGAAISGTVRYDDGSPAVNLSVHLYRKQKDGSWKTAFLNTTGPFSLLGLNVQTDDRGQYREAGLVPGVYTVEARLPIMEMSVSGLFGQRSLTVYAKPANALEIFMENATRLSDAKAMELGAGEERTDADITIPLTGLHSLIGTVTAKTDGHGIAHGTIQLLDPKDKTVLRKTTLQKDGTFNFRYVPNGQYLVRIDGLKDSSDGEPAHVYGEIDQSLVVQGDMNALVFVAPEQGTAPTEGPQ